MLSDLSPQDLVDLRTELFTEPPPLPQHWQTDADAVFGWLLEVSSQAALAFRAWQAGVPWATDALFVMAGTIVPSIESVVEHAVSLGPDGRS